MSDDWWKAVTVYAYYDGPTLFTATREKDQNLIDFYLFRLVDDPRSDEDRPRGYKADGHDITITEDEVDWSEATS